eukprot:gene18463-24945_t
MAGMHPSVQDIDLTSVADSHVRATLAAHYGCQEDAYGCMPEVVEFLAAQELSRREADKWEAAQLRMAVELSHRDSQQVQHLANGLYETVVSIPASAVGAIIGKKGRNLPTIQREWGVEILVEPGIRGNGPAPRAKCIIRGGGQVAIQVAAKEMTDITRTPDDVSRFVDRMRFEHWQKLHVFIDYSNIHISAQKLRAHPENRQGVQIDAAALLHRVLKERDSVKCVVVGSAATKEESSRLTSAWRTAIGQYKNLRSNQQGVREADLHIDEKLITSIQSSLLGDYSTDQKLVVLTGDGNLNGSNKTVWASFSDSILRALTKGWVVEVHCWKDSGSQVYRNFQRDYPEAFQLYYLDPYQSDFVKPLVQDCSADSSAKSTPASDGPKAGPLPPKTPPKPPKPPNNRASDPSPHKTPPHGRDPSPLKAPPRGLDPSPLKAPPRGRDPSPLKAPPRGRDPSPGPSRNGGGPKQQDNNKGKPTNRGRSPSPFRKGTPGGPSLQQCKYFLERGGCKYGAKCRFSHDNILQDRLNQLDLKDKMLKKEQEENQKIRSENERVREEYKRVRECSICYQRPELMYSFPCGHKVCKDCGENIIATNKECYSRCHQPATILIPRFE